MANGTGAATRQPKLRAGIITNKAELDNKCLVCEGRGRVCCSTWRAFLHDGDPSPLRFSPGDGEKLQDEALFVLRLRDGGELEIGHCPFCGQQLLP